MNALLSAADVHIAYGKVEAVRSVSLDVAGDEIVTIIGPMARARPRCSTPSWASFR
jgi:ABC-type branched-subunit amino acid transport system ATPase component